jgi:hypothetical protein
MVRDSTGMTCSKCTTSPHRADSLVEAFHFDPAVSSFTAKICTLAREKLGKPNVFSE